MLVKRARRGIMHTNNYSRRAFLKNVGLGAAVFAAQGCMSSFQKSAGKGGKHPNILFILADDLGWGDVGYHGSMVMTPNIDRLATEGVRFEQHYVTPLCSPTRAGLLSGRYPSRFGLVSWTNEQVFDFGTVTLASALRSCGYQTCITGKWHLGSKAECGPLKFGFDHSYGSFAGGVHPYTHRYGKNKYSETWHRDDQRVDEQGHATDLIAREVVRRIEDSAGSGKPFFIYVAFTAVHYPIVEPQEWIDKYDGKPLTDEQKRFAACTTHMDSAIGRMIDALERTGQRENTLVVFASDNGAHDRHCPSANWAPPRLCTAPVMGNKPFRGWKSQVYEGGIRVPALVNWPGVIKPGKVSAPVHIVDWMPTFCWLVGYKQEQDLKWDGHDIWPLIAGRASGSKRRALYWRHKKEALALRYGDWKLIVNGNVESAELYNLADDPGEQQNLAEQYPKRVEELRALLIKEMEKDPI